MKRMYSENEIIEIVLNKLGFKPTLEDNSWETIAYACRLGIASRLWEIGSTKTLYYNDGEHGAQNLIAVLVDNSPRYKLTGKDEYNSLTFQCQYLLPQDLRQNSGSVNSNVGGWKDCELRQTLNASAFLSRFDSELLAVLKEVDVKSGTGGGSTSGVSTSANKLFLPAETEISATHNVGIGDAEGTQFEFWKGKNESARIKKNTIYTGIRNWWLRTPQASVSDAWAYVSQTGFISRSGAYNLGIDIVFCL